MNQQKQTCRPFDGGSRVELYGRPYDWNMSKNPEAREEVSMLADVAGVDVYSPIPSFEADIVRPDELTEEVAPRVYRGVKADGVVLEAPGQAYALSNADCPVVGLRDPQSGVVVGLHAGRESLYDRAKVVGGCEQDDRPYDSIIMNGVRTLVEEYGAKPRNVEAFIALSIGAEHFEHRLDHEVYGEANRKMVEYFASSVPTIDPDDPAGCLDLLAIIALELVAQGVPSRNIKHDGNDTFADTDGNDNHRWWSCRRGDSERNLALVIRNE